MKKVGVPFTPLFTPLMKSSRTRSRKRTGAEIVEHDFTVHAGLRGQPGQCSVFQGPLMLEDQVVHGPERLLPAMRTHRFRRLRGMLGVGMDFIERKVPEDEAQPIAKALLDLFDDRIGPTAVGALVVSVLDQGQGSIGISLPVVPVADRKGEPTSWDAPSLARNRGMLE